MKTWDQFFPDVLIAAPGTSQPLARHAIRRAAQEFMRNTRAWQVELDPTTTTATDLSYAIELPSRTELVRIESATLAGEPFAVWRAGEQRCRTRHLYTRDAVNFVFSEQPGADQAVVLTCALMPADTATGVDDAIFRQYSKQIAIGAIAEITSDPARVERFNDVMADVRYALWQGRAAIAPRAHINLF